jgi:hypothetical protein
MMIRMLMLLMLTAVGIVAVVRHDFGRFFSFIANVNEIRVF